MLPSLEVRWSELHKTTVDRDAPDSASFLQPPSKRLHCIPPPFISIFEGRRADGKNGDFRSRHVNDPGKPIGLIAGPMNENLNLLSNLNFNFIMWTTGSLFTALVYQPATVLETSTRTTEKSFLLDHQFHTFIAVSDLALNPRAPFIWSPKEGSL